MGGSENGYPGVKIIIVSYMIVTFALLVTILTKGLHGEFAGNIQELSTSSTRLTATSGLCQVLMSFQGEGEGAYVMSGCAEMDPADRFPDCYPTGVAAWHPENNVILQMPNPSSCSVSVSETWTVAGWDITYVQIGPNAVFTTAKVPESERVAIKILQGTLIDVNVNGVLHQDGRWETFTVTPPNRAVSLFIDNDITNIQAGDGGATIAYMTIPKEYLNTPIVDMDKPPINIFAGPYSEHFEWVPYSTYYDYFEGVDFNNFASILLQNYDGSRLMNMQFWTLREDMDADNYHVHNTLGASGTFGELHMALYQATGAAGMQTSLPGTLNLRYEDVPESIAPVDEHKWNEVNQTVLQVAIPLPPGHIHGPLWSIDPETGKPTYICNGAIQYPFHRWIAGRGKGSQGYHTPPRYSSWVAFEHPPEQITVPTTMLEYWANAYLQTTKDPLECSSE